METTKEGEKKPWLAESNMPPPPSSSTSKRPFPPIDIASIPPWSRKEERVRGSNEKRRERASSIFLPPPQYPQYKAILRIQQQKAAISPVFGGNVTVANSRKPNLVSDVSVCSSASRRNWSQFISRLRRAREPISQRRAFLRHKAHTIWTDRRTKGTSA